MPLLRGKKGLMLRPPFFHGWFYGWLILGISTLGVLFSLPGQTNGVSAFTEELIRSTGLSRGNLSLAYLIGTLGSALLLSYGGRLYDRLGARLLGSFVSVALSLALLLAAASSQILPWLRQWQIAGLTFLPFCLFVLIFFLLRFLGQGVLTLTSRNLLMQWFARRRGFANAIMGLFVAFGFSLAPKLFHYLIERWQWYGTWFFLGLLELCFAALFFLLSRNTPRAVGQSPDGERETKARTTAAIAANTSKKMRKAASSVQAQETEMHWTLEQAQRTRCFWVFNASLTLQAMFVTAQTFHIASVFTQVGLSSQQAFSIFFPAAVLAAAVNFFASWFSDRVSLRYLLCAQAVGLGLSAFSQTLLGQGQWLGVAYASWGFWGIVVGNGIAGGLFNLINTVSWPRFFGTRHLGAISGRSMAFMVGGSALGPYLFSLSAYLGTNYNFMAYLTAIISLAVIVLILQSREPGARKGHL